MLIVAISGDWLCVKDVDEWILFNTHTNKTLRNYKRKQYPRHDIALITKWDYSEVKPTVYVPSLSAINRIILDKVRKNIIK